MNQERVALGYKCFHCGTPLPLRRTGLVRCPQCEGENVVELPGPAAPPAPPSTGAATTIALVVLSGLTLLFAGLFFSGISARQLLGRRGPPEPPFPAPGDVTRGVPPKKSGALTGLLGGGAQASSIVSWVGSPGGSGPQLVDADGDGAPDLVGFGVISGATQLMAVQAATGKILWKSEVVSDPSRKIFSDGAGALVLGGDKDFSLVAIDPRSGAERWSQRLSDKPEAVSFAPGCLQVRVADGARVSLALDTGGSAPCAGAPRPLTPWEKKSLPLQAGAVELSFSSTSPGTPRVIVRATKGAQKLWEQTLPISTESSVRSPGDVPHALTPTGLLVAGKPPGEEALSVLLLDLETGVTRSSHALLQKEMHGAFFVHLAVAGQAVILETFGKAYGLALPALEPRWEAGSMW
jgi:hypothetical protein